MTVSPFEFLLQNLVGTGGLVLQVVTVLSTLTAATGINMITKATSSTDLEKYDLKGKAAMMTAALMMIGLQSAIINVVTVFRPLGCTVPFPSSVISSRKLSFPEELLFDVPQSGVSCCQQQSVGPNPGHDTCITCAPGKGLGT